MKTLYSLFLLVSVNCALADIEYQLPYDYFEQTHQLKISGKGDVRGELLRINPQYKLQAIQGKSQKLPALINANYQICMPELRSSKPGTRDLKLSLASQNVKNLHRCLTRYPYVALVRQAALSKGYALFLQSEEAAQMGAEGQKQWEELLLPQEKLMIQAIKQLLTTQRSNKKAHNPYFMMILDAKLHREVGENFIYDAQNYIIRLQLTEACIDGLIQEAQHESQALTESLLHYNDCLTKLLHYLNNLPQNKQNLYDIQTEIRHAAKQYYTLWSETRRNLNAVVSSPPLGGRDLKQRLITQIKQLQKGIMEVSRKTELLRFLDTLSPESDE